MTRARVGTWLTQLWRLEPREEQRLQDEETPTSPLQASSDSRKPLQLSEGPGWAFQCCPGPLTDWTGPAHVGDGRLLY